MESSKKAYQTFRCPNDNCEFLKKKKRRRILGKGLIEGKSWVSFVCPESTCKAKLDINVMEEKKKVDFDPIEAIKFLRVSKSAD